MAHCTQLRYVFIFWKWFRSQFHVKNENSDTKYLIIVNIGDRLNASLVALSSLSSSPPSSLHIQFHAARSCIVCWNGCCWCWGDGDCVVIHASIRWRQRRQNFSYIMTSTIGLVCWWVSVRQQWIHFQNDGKKCNTIFPHSHTFDGEIWLKSMEGRYRCGIRCNMTDNYDNEMGEMFVYSMDSTWNRNRFSGALQLSNQCSWKGWIENRNIFSWIPQREIIIEREKNWSRARE